MAIDTPAGVSSRPRPWLLVLLGLAVAAYLLTTMFSGPTGPQAVTTTAPRAANAQPAEKVDPAELDVKLETLSPPDRPAEANRNPFRFQPKAPPPPDPMPRAPRPP